MRFFLFCLLFVEHHYSCNEKAVTKTACYSETPVLADPNWSDSSSVISGTAHLQQPLSPSLKGFDFPETSAINCSEHRRDGGEPECPLEMLALQTSMQGHGSTLSKLRESLAQMLRQALRPQWQSGSFLELVSGKRSFAKITTKKDQKCFGERKIKEKLAKAKAREAKAKVHRAIPCPRHLQHLGCRSLEQEIWLHPQPPVPWIRSCWQPSSEVIQMLRRCQTRSSSWWRNLKAS